MRRGHGRARRPARLVGLAGLALAATALAGCGDDADGGDGGDEGATAGATLRISAIPDQDPSLMAEREGALAAYLSDELDVDVEYVPVTDYTASVNLFRTGDLDLVFYGGLTGVQARLQAPDARLVGQRDIDESFETVFIASAEAGIEPFDEVAGLTALEGTRFTFGSESSTSGRLMPEYFLAEAGLDPRADLGGEPGFSGSHDKTLDLVESGTYETGALNAQVWEARLEAGTVDTDRVEVVFTTPTYHDYHWLAAERLDERMGEGFTDDLVEAMLDLDGSDADEREVLELYGAERIVPTEAENYAEIEQVARDLGLLG